MMSGNKTIDNLYKFAKEQDLVVNERSEIGFCRPCVSLSHKSADGYALAYNPININTFDYLWAYDARMCPREIKNAYHKGNYFAVLVTENNSHEAALYELARWIQLLQVDGDLVVEQYHTGAVGVQAIFSGTYQYALRLKGAE